MALTNAGRGGTPTEALNPVLPPLLADSVSNDDERPTLVLFDNSINDACSRANPVEQVEAEQRLNAGEHAIHIRAAVEAQVRWLMLHRPSLALLRVESYFPDCDSQTHNQLRAVYGAVHRHYGLPLLSYAAAVRPGQHTEAWGPHCDIRAHSPQCNAHPPPAIHKLIATVLLRSFTALSAALPTPLVSSATRLAAPTLPAPLSPAPLLDELSVRQPLSYFSAVSPQTSLTPSTFRGNWVRAGSGHRPNPATF